MPSNAMILLPLASEPSQYGPEDRPALVVTPKGLKACKATRPTRLYTLTPEGEKAVRNE